MADWETHEYDAVTGEHITLGLFHSSQVIAAPDGSLLVANEQGQVETFPDIFGADVESFPGPRPRSCPSSRALTSAGSW